MLALLRKVHDSLDGRYALVTITAGIIQVIIFSSLVFVGLELWAKLPASSLALAANVCGHLRYTFPDHRLGTRISFWLFKVGMFALSNAVYMTLVGKGHLGPWTA